VVRDEVGRHVQHRTELARGSVPGNKSVHDRQPSRITERGMNPRPFSQGGSLSAH
jgi:hypothetical protein